MKKQETLSPYDMWKDKADMANKYRDSYLHKREVIVGLSALLLLSVVVNVFLISSVC